ncbi:MAG: hypothetical protein EBT92_02520 [Planctomycetes bacterium]|nr:hypothetical protein [Planctomycetota bacterium]
MRKLIYFIIGFCTLFAFPSIGKCELPADLPAYQIQMNLDTVNHLVDVNQKATWTNRSDAPVRKIVFVTHSNYVVPDSDIALMAKTLELLRLNPGDSLGVKTPCLEIKTMAVLDKDGKPRKLKYQFSGPTKTTLEFDLDSPLAKGEKITFDLEFRMRLPEKQGRWGHWKNVTFLTNWLPIFAYHKHDWHAETPNDTEQGWKPTPFIPWHQPFYNEAGIYDVTATLDIDQQIASTGTILREEKLANGRKKVHLEAKGTRDFAFLCSTRFKILETEIKLPGRETPLKVKIQAFEEHEFYAKEFMRIVCECMVTYSHWFGPYPYPEFTIVESYFGWNGNECGSLVMIDERIFSMPHFAKRYAEYLISHEVCHQWWYNLVGTDGYRETWMDEALATYFSHRFLNQTRGKNNELLEYPDGLKWMPNIKREDYRMNGFYGSVGRGDNTSILKPMDKFGHVVTLFSMCYDKGAKIVEMIESRIGEQAFLDVMRGVRKKYEYKVMHVSDFQKELETQTGKSWEDFFEKWLKGTGLTDWNLESVKINDAPLARKILPISLRSSANPKNQKTTLTIIIKQNAEYSEQTYLGFAMGKPDEYSIRIPILPSGGNYGIDDPPTTVENLAPDTIKVVVDLPEIPIQIAIDPDSILVDKNPSNNYWHHSPRFRLTPLYTFVDETSLTNSYDRWNFNFGPWLYMKSYDDVWYSRATMVGLRAGAYRSQEFSGGLYTAYRTDYRDFIAGIDGLFTHWPDSPFQFGFNAERRFYTFYEGNNEATRASVFGRYVFMEHPSLYLLPSKFIDIFGSFHDNFLPDPIQTAPGAQRFQHMTTGGLHYRINYLTPYWDPEGGYQFDAVYEAGQALLNEYATVQKVWAQASTVHYLPNLSGLLDYLPGEKNLLNKTFNWIADTRLAIRAFGGTSVPSYGQFFTMGGGEMFRAFDLAQRQGNTVWVGSAELRFPVSRNTSVDAVDHLFSLKNTYLALFYDVGNTYVNGQALGTTAQGVGVGIRCDISFMSFVEKMLLRFDAAQAINQGTGTQFWFGVNQPF